ncbi:MAG: GspE/PulE family protein [Syntrophaceae bacterium]|nr:GspE/PulE family protein [Syntrophaceae bacterium]
MGVQPNLETQASVDDELRIRKNLQEITNRIHAAQNIPQILVELKDGILNLFNAYSITIYVVDQPRNEIYSMFLAGSQLKEIRVPINNRSIAGYVASTYNIVNISDAYNQAELKALDFELTFDSSWDKKSGFRTRQILAIPFFYQDKLMGVMQLINRKKGDNKFTEAEIALAVEIAETLGIAFHNQQRFARRRKTRFDFLVSRGLISDQELEASWDEAREQKETIEKFMMNKYRISKDDIGRSFEEFFRCRFISFNEKTVIPGDLTKNLKKDYLQRELWVPLEKIGDNIHVIVDDPNNIIKRDAIENLLKTKKVKYDVALPEDILKYINMFFGGTDTGQSFTDLLGKMEDEVGGEEEEGTDAVTESDSVIMQLVNKIINDASVRRCSDIHIEPNVGKKNVEIRFRVDGDCGIYQTVPFSYRQALISRVKIMSNLDITEKRKPQDGKIKFRRSNGDDLELRVATIPTSGGVEDIVMRLLAKSDTLMPLDGMGLLKRNLDELVKVITKPYGMVLVVGPTGSGKTTTLHSALHHINTPDKKIWTAEDPVEITQYGLRQVQVQSKIGFDFAAAMRAFLRADPDVIMVGEMRDYETAKTGVEASLTGHLVFSTLHTNSAPETITRLLDMGIDPLNFADALLGILAQRLVRTLCKSCKEEYHPTKDEFEEIVESYGAESFAKLGITYDDKFRLYRSRGCDACDKTGYKGRLGIHELVVATDSIKKLIMKKEPVEVLRAKAMEEGMTTLLQDGILKALKGMTDFNQVRRVCIK